MNLSILRQQYPNLRDYTDSELMDVVAGAAGVQSGSPQYRQLESQFLGYDRTAGQAAKDLGLGLVQGVTGIGQTVSTLGAALIPGVRAFDNAATNAFDRWGKALDQYKSPGLQAQESGARVASDIAERQAAADGSGKIGQFFAGAGAQAGNYLRNPGLAVQDLTTSAPTLLAGGGVGRLVQGGVRLAGAGASAAARAGIAGGVGAAATLQGGDVAGDTYERMRALGADYDTAAAGATEAGVKGGAVSLGLSLLPGASTIERSMLRGAAPGAAGRVAGAVRGGVGEFVSEAGEEGYGRFAGNQAVQQVDPNQNLMQGVGAAAVQGGVAAGPLGAVGGMRSGRPGVRPTTTATGELDMLGGTTPAQPDATNYEVPAYQRRGLNPVASLDAPPSMADLAGPAINPVQTSAPTYADLYAPAAQPDPFTAWQQQAAAAPQAPRAAPTGPQVQGQGVMLASSDGTVLPAQSPEQLQTLDAVRRAQEQQATATPPAAAPAQAAQPTIMVTPDGTAIPVRSQAEMESVNAARENLANRQAQERAAIASGQEPNRGAVLAALTRANADLGGRAVTKGGEVAKTAAAAPLRQVLESKTPLATMRELYQDGAQLRDELLDNWHKQITGQTIADWKATPPTNSAGFVPEPLPQVRAQVAAVREGRKAVAVMGEQEARAVPLQGLAQGVAVGPDGARAVVVSQDPAAVQNAVARAKEVGLKVAMGEALGYANPNLTSQAEAPAGGAVAVQQVDNRTGQIIGEELATPADLPNVRAIPDTTARIVPVNEPVAGRLAAQKDSPKAKKAPSLKRQSTEKIIETVENAKDEAEYNDALYELYRRQANDSDDGKSLNYLEKNPPTATEQAMLRERFAAERGQERGRKFGAGGDGMRLRTGPQSPARSMSQKEVQDLVQQILARVPNAPRITVAENPQAAGIDVPPGVSPVAGVDGGRIFIFSDEALSPNHVAESVFHELFHYGLRSLVTRAQYHGLMNELQSRSPEVSRLAAEWKRGNDARSRLEAGMPTADFNALAVEEALAQVAERLNTGDGMGTAQRNALVRTIGAWFARVADALGMTGLAQRIRRMSFNEVERFVQDAIGRAGDTERVVDAVEARRAGAVFREGETQRYTETPETAPIAKGAKELAAYTRALAKGEELSPTLLSLMTVRQISDQFGNRLPAFRVWADAAMERGAAGSKIAAEADRVALQWQKAVKDKAERRALAEVLLRASNAELQLDNTTESYLASLSPAERTEHAALRAKLQALSPEAQAVRTQALDVLKRQWDYTRQALETFITQTVADPGMRAARLQDLAEAMGRNHGDYFPLSRFGDRVVVARGAAADGRDIVTFHESVASQDAEVRRLKDMGVKPSDIVSTVRGEYDRNSSGSTGFVRELHNLIDQNIEDGDANQQMHEALQQLYLKSLPELSGAKHMIRRESVEGYSTDALRAFADAVTRGSRYAAHLEFAPRMQAAMEAAEAQSRSADKRTAAVVVGTKEGSDPVILIVSTGTDRLTAVQRLVGDGYTTNYFNTVPDSVRERLAAAVPGLTDAQLDSYHEQLEKAVAKSEGQVEDLRAAKQLHNHMVKLQKSDGGDPSKIVEVAGQLGYAWYLGFSPAFWAMNTLQNPMIGMPHLGSKYGLVKAAGEWMSAMKWFTGVRMGKLLADKTTPFSIEWLRKSGVKGLSKLELDMLQTLEDRQVLDFTQAADLSRIGAATDGKWYKAMRLAAAGAHHTEVFNRVSFALAAYRLAMKSSPDMTHEAAVKRTEDDVAAVHFDYSTANKPYAMGRGAPAARLVFMFQQYRQHMLYWWANTVKDAVKGETPEARTQARKAALLMGATNLVFAGTMGLPFVGAIGLLASLFAGGEPGDEPFDFERWMREAAVGLTGSTAAGEVLSKGIFTALGVDISKRIGQGDLLPLLNTGSARFERNADDKMRAYLFDLLGPLGSIALGTARAWEAFAEGDTLKGLAATTPKAAADLIRAYQLQTEGMKDKRGNFIATAEAFDGADVAAQALGMTPAAASNIRQARAAVSDIQYAFQDQKKLLTRHFIEAWARGDAEGVQEALTDIQGYNKRVATGRYADPKLLLTQQNLADGVRERQQRAMMLALTGGLAETRQQLLIATRMSGLYDNVGGMLQQAAPRPADGNGLPALPTLD